MPEFRCVRRLLVSSRALLGVPIVAVLFVALPAAASAAPLAEVEPNNSRLSANGPIPVDGFLSTINVRDDVDYLLFRLQGRRQVAVTFSALSGANGCGASLNIDQADGNTVASLGAGLGTTDTRTFTTPRDATEYFGRINAAEGCQTLVKVSPADALIVGPLPPPMYNRTLSVTAPGQVGQSASVPITASGVAADEDRIAVQWTTGGCAASPNTNLSSTIFGSTLAAGPYNVTLQTKSPTTAGPATLCTWLYDTLGKLEPLLRQQTVTVTAPPPPPVDSDDDGIPAGPDCNDNDDAIKPGAAEVPGNAVDENCDGRAEPFPRVPGSVTLSATPLRSGTTRIKSLRVSGVPREYAARLICHGRGCRRRDSDISDMAKPGQRTLSLTRFVYGVRLSPGATLSIRITREGYQSRIFKYTMQRRRAPSLSRRCAAPGASASFAC